LANSGFLLGHPGNWHHCSIHCPELLSMGMQSNGRVMKKYISLVATLAATIAILAGCASSSGVFQDSSSTYRIATRATWELGGRAGAVKMALKEATEFCAKQGATLKVISSAEDYGHFEGGTVDMRFSCERQ
jgi:predicted small secreted protein